MRCPRCNTEIPDNMAFCGKCGTPKPRNYPPTGSEYTYPTPPPVSNPNLTYTPYTPTPGTTANPGGGKPAKKGASKVVTVVVSLIAAAISFTFFSNLAEKSVDKTYGSNDSSVVATESTAVKVANSAYTEIFSSRFIVVMEPVFFGLDGTSFAAVLDDGVVERLSFGYKNDIVKEMHDDVYIPVSDYTDEQKAVMENNVKSEYAELEAYDFAEITYSMGATYFSVHMKFKNLDNTDNLSVLADYGMLENNSELASMKLTRESLLASGFVER